MNVCYGQDNEDISDRKRKIGIFGLNIPVLNLKEAISPSTRYIPIFDIRGCFRNKLLYFDVKGQFST